MDTATVGKVLVSARIENVIDLYAASQGQIGDNDIRRVEVSNALVDTGASHLGMPKRLIDQLGIPQISTGRARTTVGYRMFGIYGPVRLTIQDWFCSVDVTEIADECPVLIGYIPLENLDFVVDPKNQELIGNPEHNGEFIIDML